MTDVDGAAKRAPGKPVIPPEVGEAIQWMVRLSSTSVTNEDRRQLADWLRESPAHVDAWRDLSSSLDPFLVASENQRQHGAFAERALRPRATRRTALLGLLSFGALAGGGAVLTNRFIPIEDLLADHVTATGQRESLVLLDDTRLELGPRTAIDVDSMRREVSLRQGDILIKGQANASDPIVVTTKAMTMQATGGTFVVHERPGLTRMIAVTDMARVACDGRTIDLAAGHCVQFDGARMTMRRVDAKTATSWVDGILYVDAESLATVVSRLEPYFAGVIRVDPSIGALPVTGVFPLTDTARALALLANGLDVSIKKTTPYWVTIGPTVPA